MMFNKVIFFHIQLKTHSWQHDEDIYDVVEKLLQKTLRHLMYFVVTSSSEKHFHFLCWDIKNSKKKILPALWEWHMEWHTTEHHLDKLHWNDPKQSSKYPESNGKSHTVPENTSEGENSAKPEKLSWKN